MKREIERYLKEIEGKLYTCPRKRRKAFLRDLRGNIHDYIAEHPNATLPEIRSVFGSPGVIAENILQSEDFTITKTVVSSQKWCRRILAVAVCILVAGVLVLGTIYVVDTYNFNHGYETENSAQEGTIPPNAEALASY